MVAHLSAQLRRQIITRCRTPWIGPSKLDRNVKATILRHGNFDYVNNAVIWDATISDHAIPNSLFYSSQPSWWTSGLPWPPIGPDLTPRRGRIPAQVRYETMATPTRPLAIIQPNGGEVWLTGSVHQIKWDSTNLKHSDHLILQYSRDGGASWFTIAQDIPAFTFGYWWQVDNFPTTQGRVKILLQRTSVDQRPERRELHCAARAVDHAPHAERRRVVDGRAEPKLALTK